MYLVNIEEKWLVMSFAIMCHNYMQYILEDASLHLPGSPVCLSVCIAISVLNITQEGFILHTSA